MHYDFFVTTFSSYGLIKKHGGFAFNKAQRASLALPRSPDETKNA